MTSPDLRPAFDDERQRAMYNIALTYNVILGRTLAALKPFDLNDQHYNILKTLEHRHPEPVSVGDVMDMLVQKRGDITRLMDKLVAKGLVARAAHLLDRRVVHVALTALGVAELGHMDTNLSQQRDILSNLTPDEAKDLNFLLDKLRS